MKFLLICNSNFAIVHFRLPLIKKLVSDGNDVSIIAFDDDSKEEIESTGAKLYKINDSNRSTNPVKVLSLKTKIKRIIQSIKPEVVFTFQLKPNIFGVLAAHECGIKDIYSMVEGAGDPFIYDSLKWKAIRTYICLMLNKSFKYSKKVFFLNNNDKKDYINRKILKSSQCMMVNGVGVDLDEFKFSPITNTNTFVMIARMLKTKGVFEYCEAAKIVKEKYPNIIFNYIGPEASLKISDIQEYIDKGIINYIGSVKYAFSYISDSFVNVLPSYREGVPMTVMEACSIGRPTIAFDVPGCNSAIKDSYNGFLVEFCNVQKLADKMIWCIENVDKVKEMGINARKYAEDNFDQREINKQICKVIYVK